MYCICVELSRNFQRADLALIFGIKVAQVSHLLSISVYRQELFHRFADFSAFLLLFQLGNLHSPR